MSDLNYSPSLTNTQIQVNRFRFEDVGINLKLISNLLENPQALFYLQLKRLFLIIHSEQSDRASQATRRIWDDVALGPPDRLSTSPVPRALASVSLNHYEPDDHLWPMPRGKSILSGSGPTYFHAQSEQPGHGSKHRIVMGYSYNRCYWPPASK